MGVSENPEYQTCRITCLKLRELSQLAILANNEGMSDEQVDVFTAEALFATLTNVNFDPQAIAAYLRKAEQFQLQIQAKLFNKNPYLKLEPTIEGMVAQGRAHGIDSEPNMDPDLTHLQWPTYGLKGIAANYHAYLLGKKDPKVFDFLYEGLAAPLNKALDINAYIGLVFKCGEINIRAMELLDAGNTERYGHPTPTKVPLGHKKGKAILVSGHDLIDLEEIL